MKKLSLAFLPIVAAGILLSACSPQPTPAAAVPLSSQPDLLIAEGRLLPVNSLDQAFSVPGQVAQVLVQDGDSIAAGQVLARLTGSPEAQSALARARQEVLAAQQALDALDNAAGLNLAQARLAQIEAQAAFDAAENRYDANDSDENGARLDQAAAALEIAEDIYGKLAAGAGVDPDQLAAAEARLAAAEAVAASAQAAMDALELKSSLGGTIVDLDLQAGQRLAAGEPVLTVADFSSWVVKTDNLTETEVVNLEVGQQAGVTLDALPSTPLSGEVTHINARYEEKRGDITYTVTLVLSQSDPLLRWGMTAAVQFLP